MHPITDRNGSPMIPSKLHNNEKNPALLISIMCYDCSIKEVASLKQFVAPCLSEEIDLIVDPGQ